MKNTINRYLAFMVILLMSLAITHSGTCQKKDRVRMKLAYSKDKNNERSITITLTAGSGKSMHGVKNGTVSLSAIQGDSTMTFASLETDTLGVAKLYIENGYKLPVNEDGISMISGTYVGDESYNEASSEMQISDLNFEITFEERDSIKYLVVTANQSDIEGNKLPVGELEISIGVDRLFSVLPVGQVTTDADGWAELELSQDLPGDAAGNLTFVAYVDEHDIFGTVKSAATKDWGVPVSYEVKPLPRQLFTNEAPFWMIASVFIILIGAWYHFFLSISKLIKLKKAG